MKLLLDVHHSRLAAERLRVTGHDVVAAADLSELATLADDELLRNATAEERALVTENVKDFDRILRAWVASGEQHAGLIFTSPRRFHREARAIQRTLSSHSLTFSSRHPTTRRTGCAGSNDALTSDRLKELY